MTPPNVTFAGVPCTNPVPAASFSPSPLHNTLSCLSPVGVGTGQAVTVVVSGQSSAGRFPSPVLWSYNPPVVTSISPATGPTAGAPLTNVTSDGIHYALGPPIVVTLTGSNLGPGVSAGGSVSFAQPPWAAAAALAAGQDAPMDVVVANTSIGSWNHTTIVFLMPPGFGEGLIVTVKVGGQSSSDPNSEYTPPVLFSYAPPSVLSVVRYDVPISQCASRPLCFSFGTQEACKLVPAGCFGTQVRVLGVLVGCGCSAYPAHPPRFPQGAYEVAIVGESFGAVSASTVTIDGLRCPVALPPPTHNLIICTAPQVGVPL